MLWPFTSKRDAKLLPRPTSQLISFSHVVDDELLTLLYIDKRLSVWFAQAPRNYKMLMNKDFCPIQKVLFNRPGVAGAVLQTPL